MAPAEAGPIRSPLDQVVREVVGCPEAVRGDAVRYLCPCHAGWELFEEHVGVLHRLLKDPSDVVRRHALHVFEDAARMQSRGDLEYCVEADEEKIGEKRTSCYRSMEQRFEARRARKISKRKSLRLRSI